ncbi:uncharacterized protein K444DRAFT_146362 [Hyaloscypha bicolor E]|uniref:Uncharacterized protein n=1 Tax=Hyaloscypha bicolor E TaxID=1095630 RepID=A0A2J6SSJ2_9HELO|nr:uncharacterized protein K444DRAFT_146362 [Hyaloscypha bicolor E]PMD53758.1 hypothetical protein K444DRAFT_146362 [Hyaloscypha bicolor E]
MASRQQLIGSIAGAASQLNQFPQPTSRVTTSFVLSLFGLWLTLGPEHEKIVFPMSSPCYVSAPFLKRAKRLSSQNGSGPLGRQIRSFAASAVPAITPCPPFWTKNSTEASSPPGKTCAPHALLAISSFSQRDPLHPAASFESRPPRISWPYRDADSAHLLTAGNEHKKAG